MANLNEEQRTVILNSLKEINMPDPEYTARQIEGCVCFPEDALMILSLLKMAKVAGKSEGLAIAVDHHNKQFCEGRK